MSLSRVFLFVFSFIILSLLAFVWYSGLFAQVEVEQKEQGPFLIVYEEHTGDYRNIRKLIDSISVALVEAGIQEPIGFGKYFDDPGKTPAAQLRSWGGCIIPEKAYPLILSLETNCQVSTIEKDSFVVADFPFRNTFSLFFAVFRVYPAINTYINNNQLSPGPNIEIYDSRSGKLRFLMEI